MLKIHHSGDADFVLLCIEDHNRGLLHTDHPVISADHLRNEYSQAKLNGNTVAIVPDLLFIFDREIGEAIATEALRFGQRVKVIGVAATEEMRTEQAIEVIGPKASKIKEPCVSLEDLAWRSAQ